MLFIGKINRLKPTSLCQKRFKVVPYRTWIKWKLPWFCCSAQSSILSKISHNLCQFPALPFPPNSFARYLLQI